MYRLFEDPFKDWKSSNTFSWQKVKIKECSGNGCSSQYCSERGVKPVPYRRNDLRRKKKT